MPDEHNSRIGARGYPAAAAGDSPAATAVLAEGILDGRYQLQTQVAQRGPVALWRGDDLVLARAVAVRVLAHSESEAGAQRLLAAAVRSGRLVHAGAASTYDATTTETRFGPVTYVVSEWVDGETLTTLLDEGPLSAERSVRIVLAVARVLAAAHAREIAHGDLHPGDVVLTPHGGVKVLDLEVRAALADDTPLQERKQRDVVALGALLYSCLTGRWPLGGGRGLSTAPNDADGRLCTPRQVRAGVPRELDGLALAALGDDRGEVRGRAQPTPITSAAQVVDALEAIPVEPEVYEPTLIDAQGGSGWPAAAGRRARKPSWRRRRVLVPLVLLLICGVAAWLFGVALGRLPGPSDKLPAINSTSGRPGPPLPLAAVTSFDPNGDGTEQEASVGLAHDNNPSTSWFTDTYATSNFGNLKPGVGLKVDLGRPETVHQVQLSFVQGGQSVQLRAADADGTSQDAYQTVAEVVAGGKDVTLTPTSTTPHRYWVIWLTQLPQTDRGFRAELSELSFLS